MLRVALVSVLLAVAAVADKLDDLDDDDSHQSYAQVELLPAVLPAPAAPQGGDAPADAVEVATQQFLADYARGAAAAAAAPDIDIYTTADGLPLPSAQPSYSAPAPAAPAAPAAPEPQTGTYFEPEVNIYSTSSYHQPQQPAPLLYDSEGNLLGVADTDDVAQAKRLFHAQYDAIAAELASQQGPRQAQASLLYDADGTVVGVAETDDVREAKARFQAHYDEVIAAQQAAAAPAPAPSSYGV